MLVIMNIRKLIDGKDRLPIGNEKSPHTETFIGSTGLTKVRKNDYLRFLL